MMDVLDAARVSARERRVVDVARRGRVPLAADPRGTA